MLYSFRRVHLTCDIFVKICWERGVSLPRHWISGNISHTFLQRKDHPVPHNIGSTRADFSPSFVILSLFLFLMILSDCGASLTLANTLAPLRLLFASTKPHLVMFSAHKDITVWPFVLILQFEFLLIWKKDIFYFTFYWSVVYSFLLGIKRCLMKVVLPSPIWRGMESVIAHDTICFCYPSVTTDVNLNRSR